MSLRFSAIFALVAVIGAVIGSSESAWSMSTLKSPASSVAKGTNWSKRQRVRLKQLRIQEFSSGKFNASKGVNGSYLAKQTDYDREAREKTQRMLFGNERMSAQLKSQYEDLYREYQMRQNYTLISPDQHRVQSEKNRNFGEFVLRSLLNFHLNEGLKKAEKNSEEIRTFKKVHDQVDQVVQKGLNIDVGPRFKFGTRADIPRQRGKFWMTSPWFDTSLEMYLGALDDPSSVGSRSQAFGGSSFWRSGSFLDQREERYRFGVSREFLPYVLPFQFRSGLTYGATSTRVTAFLSTQLAEHLAAVIDHSEPLRKTNAPWASPEGTARLNYSLNF